MTTAKVARAARLAAYTPAQLAIALLIAAFLLAFLIVPVAMVVYVAFAEPDGGFTLAHFQSFFHISLMRESFWNSLVVAASRWFSPRLLRGARLLHRALPVSRWALLIQTLGVAAASSCRHSWGCCDAAHFRPQRLGHLLLNDTFGVSLPIMEGLNGVIFVEALHYFPFILRIWWSRFRTSQRDGRVRAEPGAADSGCCASCSPSPCRLRGGRVPRIRQVFDDLGTPLVLNVEPTWLAPQAVLAHHIRRHRRSDRIRH